MPLKCSKHYVTMWPLEVQHRGHRLLIIFFTLCLWIFTLIGGWLTDIYSKWFLLSERPDCRLWEQPPMGSSPIYLHIYLAEYKNFFTQCAVKYRPINQSYEQAYEDHQQAKWPWSSYIFVKFRHRLGGARIGRWDSGPVQPGNTAPPSIQEFIFTPQPACHVLGNTMVTWAF